MHASESTTVPVRALSRDEVRSLDRRAIEHYGVPGVVLMENAGRGAADLLTRLWPDARNVTILCGHGNNGGDGFVIGRHLDGAGVHVRILLAASPPRIGGDAATMFEIVRRSAIPWEDRADADALAFRAGLAGADVVVDALLGTGAVGPPRGAIAAAIDGLRRRSADVNPPKVLAIDVPSGLDADSGDVPGDCVRADATATFVARKRGFAAPGAAAFTGAVHIVGIGAPRALLAEFGLPPGPVG
jgi:NAD(P)H-hydrate epimerase